MSVFWTRGYRNDGSAIQMGLVVVRPGWVAFLPIGVPMGPSEQFALGAARARGGAVLSMNVAWQGRYPIMAWYQHGGPDVIDFEVRRALEQPGAAMFTTNEAGLVVRKHTTAFVPFAPATPMITLDQPPPPALVSMWRPGVLPLDRKKLNMTTAIICAVLVLFGAGCQGLIYSVEGYWSIFPILFWGFLVGVAVFAYWRRVREHEEDLRRQGNVGPGGAYR
jgi:hypothetical protein